MAEKTGIPAPMKSVKLDKVPKRQVPAWRGKALGEIPHLTREDILKVARAAERLGRGHKGKRDRLLILVMYDACLRVSEAIGLRPMDILQSAHCLLYTSPSPRD